MVQLCFNAGEALDLFLEKRILVRRLAPDNSGNDVQGAVLFFLVVSDCCAPLVELPQPVSTPPNITEAIRAPSTLRFVFMDNPPVCSELKSITA